MRNEELYGWVFSYNPFIDKWMSTNRDNYHKLFSNIDDESVIKSSSIDTLCELIIKNKGDLSKILKIK